MRVVALGRLGYCSARTLGAICAVPGPCVALVSGSVLWFLGPPLSLCNFFWTACPCKCYSARLCALTVVAARGAACLAQRVLGSPPWSGVLCWCVACHHGRAFCARAWPAIRAGRAVLVRGPPPRFDVLYWHVLHLRGWECRAGAGPAALVGRVLLVRGQLPWLGVLYWCAARRHGRVCCPRAWMASFVGRAVQVLGLPPWSGVLCGRGARLHGRVCVLVLCQPPWSGVLLWCWACL